MLPQDLFNLVDEIRALHRQVAPLSGEEIGRDLRELHQLLQHIRRQYGSLRAFLNYLDQNLKRD